MKKLNYEFLEKYKELDNLCLQMYEEKGVTSYIDEMKNVPKSESEKIQGWEEDKRFLIGYRHIRNKLSHDVGSFDEALCTSEDVAYLESFKERIMNGTDPISRLYKARKRASSAKTQMVKTQKKAKTEYARFTDYRNESEYKGLGSCLLWILAGILIFAIAYYLFKV